MTTAAIDLLRQWLRRQLAADGADWLDGQLRRLESDFSERNLRIALGMIPRRLGKDDLGLDSGDLAAAAAARPGWNPAGWSVDMAARVLVLCRAGGGGNAFTQRFTDLCRTADVSESVAYYSGLPLYPAPELLETQAAEGVRTNMRAVFEAVAHDNPYPREQFGQDRWNQMVLKALFIGSRLAPIQGLDDRANPELAAILSDYAHERWAAARPVSPELWRCVGPFASGAALDDLKRALAGDEAAERRAAALALAASPDPAAAGLLADAGDLNRAIAAGDLTWDTIEDAPAPA